MRPPFLTQSKKMEQTETPTTAHNAKKLPENIVANFDKKLNEKRHLKCALPPSVLSHTYNNKKININVKL